MKPINLSIILISLLFGFACNQNETISPRVEDDFNFNWRFHYGDIENGQEVEASDANWKEVRLPHDWSVEQSFTQENTAGATAFLPGGIGWYKKTFSVPKDWSDRITWIEFDGVYSNSEVWINGQYLGKRPYGYIPFKYELSKFLKYGETNEITVKADRSAYIDCRWYPGSGIYRNVKLVSANKVHIPQWGVFVSTPEVNAKKATVSVQTDVANRFASEKSITVKSSVFRGTMKFTSSETKLQLKGDAQQTVQQKMDVGNPELWDIDSPNMYHLLSEIIVDGKVVDSKETTFGIRSFSFDKDKGFFLNRRNLLLKGVCLHHDGGLVGAAVPKGVWERRLKKLKAAGCNAIRTAHNPPSAEFLDLCDELGFLVQDEAFDEWNNPKDKRHNYNQQEANPLTSGYTEHFTEWKERDLKSMVLRDRNHPSIIMWSIGNEIEWTYPRYGQATGYWGSNKVGDVNYYWDEPPLSVEQIKDNFNNAEPGDYNLANTAKELADWVRDKDTTRPVTANLVIPSVSNFSGYAEALDIVGLSYRQSVYDYCKKHYPDMVFLGTENWTRYHEWKPVVDKDFISGIFLWTGINYMGESRSWPVRGSGSGLLDFAGFEKPSYQLFKALWNDEPHVFITTQTLDKSPYKTVGNSNNLVEKEANWAARQKWGWQEVNTHWNYEEGEEIAVEVYTNQPEVELFLNGKSLGIKKLAHVNDHILKWMVPFSTGKLAARAVNNSAENTVVTAGAFAGIEIKADKTTLNANGYDVVHFVVQLLDADGNPVRHSEEELRFEIEGDAKLLGVDNGAATSVQDYQSNKIVTSEGKALMILQSNLNASTVTVKAVCEEITSKELKIAIR
ncbi:sugar-binding domain-containing protein [uncultured Draconibacterium sp.]|uniref:sugar-binding domain-containing protein n=1 Tax=uncultured Draconibacterium sp. TaxID=1573823 RepID=UPI00326158A5